MYGDTAAYCHPTPRLLPGLAVGWATRKKKSKITSRRTCPSGRCLVSNCKTKPEKEVVKKIKESNDVKKGIRGKKLRKTQGDFCPSTCHLKVKPRCDASRGLKAGKDLMTPPPITPHTFQPSCRAPGMSAAHKPCCWKARGSGSPPCQLPPLACSSVLAMCI